MRSRATSCRAGHDFRRARGSGGSRRRCVGHRDDCNIVRRHRHRPEPRRCPGHGQLIRLPRREGYYDGTVVHRIAEDFVFQAGDPSADGTGGPGYVVPDEFPDSEFVYEEGVVAMANRGARSTGSQFFVVTGENGRFLTNQFSVLGTVVSARMPWTRSWRSRLQLPPARSSKVFLCKPFTSNL